MKEGETRKPTTLTNFQLDVEMRNNADTERLRLEQAKVTGVAEPRTVITEATFNELNQLVSRGGGGETLFSGTTDEPATVTVDGTDAILGNGGQSFAATVDLPTGTSTVTVEATDVNNNTTSQDYEVEVAAGSGQSLTYDANGNMTDNGSGQTYKWDAEDRLIEITRGTETTEIAYDGMSRRTRITEKSSGVTVEDHHYIWDGAEIVERRASNGTTWEQRYYAEGFVDATEGDFYYTPDHLGSIREVVADDGVTVESQYDYEIWGEVERIAGVGAGSPFRYTGHFYHAPTELHLTWFRAYDADLGRWLSRDPMVVAEFLPEGPNLYSYAASNPLLFIDLHGRAVRKRGEAFGEYEIQTRAGATFRNSSDCSQFAKDLDVIAEFGDRVDEITFRGHGNNEPKMITFGGGYVVSTGNAIVDPEGVDIVPKLRSVIGQGAKINLFGCNTARGDDNLAKDFKNIFPGAEVTGYSYYGIGLINFEIYVTLGPERTY